MQDAERAVLKKKTPPPAHPHLLGAGRRSPTASLRGYASCVLKLALTCREGVDML